MSLSFFLVSANPKAELAHARELGTPRAEPSGTKPGLELLRCNGFARSCQPLRGL